MNTLHYATRLPIVRLLLHAAAIPLFAGTVSAVVIQGNVSCSDTAPPTPLAGVTVIATGSTTAPSSVTDSNGNYVISFTFVAPDVYQVHLGNVPAGLTFVNPSDGTNLVAVIVDDMIPRTADFVLSGCASNPPPAPGTVGGWVWDDLNCDGYQDWDEPGLPGVEIELTDCDGLALTNTWSDADGYYALIDLEAGDYRVRFLAPPAYEFSPMTQDSTADPATGETVCFGLEAGETNLTWDAGFCRLEAPGVRSQGYWKNHPEEWPVDEIEIGGDSYDKLCAILMMQLPTRGDKRLNMFEQLVAAKLNILVGNEADCVEGTILMADLWMEMNPQPVPAKSPAWKCEGAYLHSELQAYNDGWLCAPPAED